LLNQEAEPEPKNAVQTVIEHAEKEVARLEKEVEEILGQEDGADNPLLEDIYERIDGLDPSTFETRACTLLAGLGVTTSQMDKNTEDMSGGWRMRVALAKALFIRPTVLLLDEPTNHLDLEACVWLEEYLKTYDRILVIVSHSQDFLNGVCTNMMHLTHKRKLIYYGGNYDQFVIPKAAGRNCSYQEIHCIRWYLCQLGAPSQVQAKDYRQDGGGRFDRESRAPSAIQV
jgi:ATP-binding cassette subfamily F protein 2